MDYERIKKYRIRILLAVLLLNAAIMYLFYAFRIREVSVSDQLYIESQGDGIFTAGSSEYSAVRFSYDLDSAPEQYTPDDDMRIPMSVTVTVSDLNGIPMWEKTFEDMKLSVYTFGDPVALGENPLNLNQGEQYRLKAVTASPDAEAGEQEADAALISVAFTGERRSLAPVFLVLCLAGCGVIIAASGMLFREPDPESSGEADLRRTAAIVMVLLGIMSCLAVPALSFPDEANHFGIVYDYVMHALGRGRECAVDALYVFETGIARRDPSMSEAGKLYRNWTDFGYGNYNTAYISSDYIRNANYVTFEYLPQMLCVGAGVLLGLPWQLTVLAGHLGSLAFCILITLLSMRICPKLSRQIAAVSLLPSAVLMCNTYSYDGWNLVMTMLFTALCVWAAGQEKLRLRHVLLLGAVFIGFVPIKYVYIVLGILIFIIPFHRTMDKKTKAGLLLAGILVIAAGLISRGKEAVELLTTSLTDDRGLGQGLYGEPYTIGWAVHHPKDILLIICKTLFTQTDSLVTKAMVSEFRNGKIPLLLAILCVFCIAGLMTMDTGLRLSRWQRFVSGAAAVLGVLCILAAFLFIYSYRTDGGYGIIAGLQGRYFLPYVLLIPLIVGGKRETFTDERNAVRGNLLLWCLCLADVWYMIYQFSANYS